MKEHKSKLKLDLILTKEFMIDYCSGWKLFAEIHNKKLEELIKKGNEKRAQSLKNRSMCICTTR